MKCDRVWLGHCSLRDHPLEFGHLTCSFHRQIIFHNYGLDCVVAAAGVNRTITCLNRCSQTAACAQSFCKLLVGGWMSVSKIRPAARAQHNLNSTKLDFHCPRATSPSPFAEALASSIYVRGRNTYALSPLIRQLMSVATSNLATIVPRTRPTTHCMMNASPGWHPGTMAAINTTTICKPCNTPHRNSFRYC
ncbi:hypothetical protein BDV98DRAFT_54051 [Pterulicium gracile]|uniref:Uncharacterized protein n=1 Tax=Pterulicium gracile TaxID=1884261 RepID=A0A5C3QJR6_9AGAR|nr:hypothetical protein BDV98DRAFT_54051 [Pterula gracilis]